MENTRRDFLKHGLQLAAALALYKPIESIASVNNGVIKKYISKNIKIYTEPLYFKHIRTGETFKINHVYGNLEPEALKDLQYFLRDYRTGTLHEMDPGLLDIIHVVKKKSHSNHTIEVISGYRTPETNALLKLHNSRVAEHSLHIQGMAIDVRFPDVRSNRIRDLALSMKSGGVGYYGKYNFIHLDTGRVRTW